MIVATGLIALALLILSVPLFIVFGASSSLLATVGMGLPWTTLLQISLGSISTQVLVAIPLFVVAGNMMLAGGTSRRLIDFALAFVGHLPGGLALAMVLSMAFFGAFCGSILAGITAIGMILLPPMLDAGYPRAFAVALAACSAILEALIPPSNTAIVFSALTHVPVSQTFAAGILPGVVLLGLLIAYVVVSCWKMPRPPRVPMRKRMAALRGAVPALITPVIILGGIYSGLLTAAESAAVAAVWGILLGAVFYRELTFRGFLRALRNAAITTTVIFSIISMAVFLSVILTFTQAPQAFVAYVTAMGITPALFFVAAAAVLLFLGTFLEIVPIFYLTLPILLPAALALHIPTLQLYVFFTGVAAIGLLTPPVCVGVYMAAAIVNEPPQRVFKAIPPFVALGLGYGLIIALFPKLATWIPSMV